MSRLARLLAASSLAVSSAHALAPRAAHAGGEPRRQVVHGLAVEWQAERVTASNERGERAACDPPYDEERAPFVELLSAELRAYTPQVWSRAGLRRVVLCRDLSVRFGHTVKRTVGGATDVRDEQPVTAFASPGEGAIFVDVARVARDARFTRRLVHHEVFHFVDRALGGRFDAAWVGEARYGTGGVDMQDEGGLGELRAGLPGFVSPYAQASLAEDKAEVFAHLVTEGAAVRAMAQKDPLIAGKLKVLEAMLRGFDPGLLALVGLR